MIGIGLNIGNRVIVSGGFDADAQAFFDRVTAAGGTLTTTEKNATNQLVLDMKSAGIWSAMRAVYPMVGASAAACAQNLKSSSFTGTFSSGWTFSSTGATPNGTSAYMNSGLNIGTVLTQTNSHASFYSRTSTDVLGAYPTVIGAYGNASYTTAIDLHIRRPAPGDIGGGQLGSFTVSSVSFVETDARKFAILSRTSATSLKYYTTGVLRATNTTSDTTGFGSVTAYIGAGNYVTGVPQNFSKLECAFASIGDGLTDTQASNFYTAVQTFNQTLNRQVGAQIVSDADAQAYINRVYTAGGTLTNTEANAVNQLVIDMKAAGIWTAMKAVYPMVGASAAACAQNLKSSSFTGTFTSGWTFASTGVTPNGSSAYMNTGLNASTELTQNSTHLSYYSRTNVIASQVEMGVASGSNTYLLFNYGGVAYSAINSGEAQRPSTANPTTGFLIGSRTSSTEERYFTNNVSQTRTANSTGRANLNIFLACYNNGGSAYLFSTKQCAFSSIGDGLTDTQAADFYTCVNTFQVSLSRNV